MSTWLLPRVTTAGQTNQLSSQPTAGFSHGRTISAPDGARIGLVRLGVINNTYGTSLVYPTGAKSTAGGQFG